MRPWIHKECSMELRALTETETAQLYDVMLAFVQERWTNDRSAEEVEIEAFIQDRIQGKPLPGDPFAKQQASKIEQYVLEIDGSEGLFVLGLYYEEGIMHPTNVYLQFSGELDTKGTELPELLGWAAKRPVWSEIECDEPCERGLEIEGVGPLSSFFNIGRGVGEISLCVDRLGRAQKLIESGIYALDNAMGDEPDHEEMTDREIEAVNCEIEKVKRPLEAFLTSQSS